MEVLEFEIIVLVLDAAAIVVVIRADVIEGMLDNAELVRGATELNVVVSPSMVFVVKVFEIMFDNAVLVRGASAINVVVSPSAIYVVNVLVWVVFELNAAPLVFAEL